ncbi:helix-turn-helix domain-containing protein [Harryflintia acetispora]|uniref:helix-turn-helix domain-containing protein n=1 Tax=Harryflintia acetispora TaxID=1849041 RepID=UPI0018991E08|nr:helix-turn-helix transcriptional regulator [Harryflintia acetispora]
MGKSYLLGDRIRSLRKEKGLSQKKLAEIVFVAQQTIGGYEKKGNVPDITVLIRLARFFEVSVDYLIGASDNRTLISADGLSDSEVSHIENLRRLSPELQDVLKQATKEIEKSILGD